MTNCFHRSIFCHICILLGLLLGYLPLQAQLQLPSYEWAAAAGTDSTCNVNAIQTDPAGFAHVASYFQGSLDADPGPGTLLLNASTGGSALIQKLDPNGNLIWAKQYGGQGKTGTNAIAQDSLGNIYIAGAYEALSDFDPGIGVQNHAPIGGWDAYVLKLDSNGNYLWVATMGSAGDDWAYALTVDAAGNAFTTGKLSGIADFDPGAGTLTLAPTGTQSAFVWKLAPNGSLDWARQYSDAGWAIGRGIALDAAGNVLTCGYFMGTIDFDPGPGAQIESGSGFEDGYAVKLDAQGDWVWGRYYGGANSDAVENITVGSSGNIVVTGEFRDSIDLDPSPMAQSMAYAGNYKATFVSQIDGNGQFLWAKAIPDSDIADGKVTQLDAQEAVYLTGQFWGSVDFDPSPTAYFLQTAGTNSDAYVLKLSATGGFEWMGAITGGGWEDPHCLAVGAAGQVWIGGNISTLTDMDPGSAIHPLGLADGRLFLAKWGQCTPPIRSISDTTCSSYLVQGYVFNQSGDYLLRSPGPPPCDSLLSLDLTFSYSETHIYRTFCFPDTLGGIVYSQPGTYTQVFQNTAQCDSNIVYHLTGNPFYRYLPLVVACEAYTFHGNQLTNSGNYYHALPGPNSACDTVEMLQLTVHHNTTSQVILSNCNPIQFNDSSYSQSGNYVQTLTNAAGCDSIITLQFTRLEATTDTVRAADCSSFALNGQTYAQTGTYTQTLTNAAGCDSLLTLILAIQATDTNFYQNACDSFSLNGMTYTASGNYTQHLTNVAGCDSTIALELHLHPPTYGAMQAAACQSFTINGQTYISSGTYSQHLQNVAGCDSTLTIFLTIWPNTSNFLILSSCDSLHLNGYSYYASGVYTQILVNAHGCDSLLNLYLTIDSLNLQVVQSGNSLSAAQSGGTYQWLRCDSIPVPIQGATGQSILAPTNGYYAVVIDHDGCQDTSACFQVTSVGIGGFPPLQDSLTSGENWLKIYPNPNSGRFWVKVDAALVGQTLEVYDALGRLVAHQTAIQSQLTVIDIDLPQAVYCLRVGRSTARLVVNREL